MTDKEDLKAFQRYQQAFTAHLRNPNVTSAALADIPTEGLSVYEDIVFTNLFEAVSACFPVAKEVLGSAVWRHLIRSFMAEHSATSPLFREIPAEFLKYLATLKELQHHDLPAFIFNLCHYEWAELAAGTYNQTLSVNTHLIERLDIKPESILDTYVVFASGLVLCNYDFAVHTISPDNLPNAETQTQLLVYCDNHFKVQFLLLNPITLRLLQLLHGGANQKHTVLMAHSNAINTTEKPLTMRDALLKITEALPDTPPEIVNAFGLDFLEKLQTDGIILGVCKTMPQATN